MHKGFIAAVVFAAIGGFAAGVALGWYIQSGQTAAFKEKAKACKVKFDAEVERITTDRKAHEQVIKTKYETAVAESNSRVAVLDRELDSVRRTSDRLRQQLADNAKRIPEAPPAAATGYAAALGELFGECTERYSTVAGQAQQHVESILKLQEAWPQNFERYSNGHD